MESNTRKYRLKELRARYNLTQQQVADKVGITRQHYSILEKDESRILKSSLEVVIALCNVFQIRIEDIFYTSI